ncbi:hypothetical protein BJ742DRAFT_769422 [Cladochytrium replicatum]|nr:hypothetical protein BJ742DRAFT_769422 [Cladochytrium replicatum]
MDSLDPLHLQSSTPRHIPDLQTRPLPRPRNHSAHGTSDLPDFLHSASPSGNFLDRSAASLGALTDEDDDPLDKHLGTPRRPINHSDSALGSVHFPSTSLASLSPSSYRSFSIPTDHNPRSPASPFDASSFTVSLIHALQSPPYPRPSPTSVAPLQDDRTNIGYLHWLSQREKWTEGHTPYDPYTTQPSYKSNPALAQVDETHFDAIYDGLVNGRRFAKPVPLAFVSTVLVHGWKREGLWAPPMPDQADQPQ